MSDSDSDEKVHSLALYDIEVIYSLIHSLPLKQAAGIPFIRPPRPPSDVQCLVVDIHVLPDPRLHAHRALPEEETRVRFTAVDGGGADVNDKGGLGVPTQTILQQARQLRVAERDVFLLQTERRDAVAERGEGQVDGLEFAESDTLRPRRLDALRTGEI